MNEPPNRQFFGGRMIFAAFVIGFCSGPGQTFTFSVFQPALLETFEISRGTFAGIYAAGSLLSAAIAAVAGRAADRFGIRRTLAVGALIMAAACFGMAVSGGLVTLAISLSVLRALGQGTMALLASLLIMQWFQRRRGRAMSVAGLGVSGANAVLPPLCVTLIAWYGWRAAYGGIGIGVIAILGALAWWVVRDRPEDLGQLPDGDSEAPPQSSGKRVDRRVLRSPRFWVLAIALASAPYVVTALVFHQASIFADRGMSETKAAGMLSLFALAAAVSTFVTGQLVDRFGVRKVLRAFLVLQIVGVGLALGLRDGAVVIIYTVIVGAVAGGSAVMGGVTWARFYGRDGLGAVQGTAGTVMLGMAALSPLPMGLLRDATGSHAIGLALCLLFPLVGLALLTRDVENMPA
jgi:sugar phosphate permease